MKKQFIILAVLGLSVTACAKQQAAGVSAYGVDKGAGSVGVHTVLPGDTVYKIAQNYQLPMREIITVNKIEAPYVLNAGYRLKLPPPNEHEVREGDTINSIAQMYEVSPNRLAQLNDLSSPYRLFTGTKLRLPTPSSSSSMAQKAVFNSAPVENASIQPVERGVIDMPPVQSTVTASASQAPAIETVQPDNTVTPARKPTLQKASVQRA